MKKDLMYSIRDKQTGKRVIKLMTRKGTLINEGKRWGYINRTTGEMYERYELVAYELVPTEIG